jgi:hypothetical protein
MNKEFNYVDFVRDRGRLEIKHTESGELHVSSSMRFSNQKIIIRDIYVSREGSIVLDRTEHGEKLNGKILWEKIDEQGIHID